MKKNFLFFLFIIKNIMKFYISSVFKTINLNDGNFLVIKQNGIYTYDKNSLLIKKSYEFENDLKLKDLEIENIPYFQLNEYDAIFILIKKNLFILSLEGEYKNEILLSINELNYYSMNMLEISNDIKCYYFIENINSNNKLNIYLYEYSFSLNTNKLLNSNEYNININDFFKCEIMISLDNKKFLTCFYENENYIEITESTFFVNDNKVYFLNSKSYNMNGAKIIKTRISYDKSKALICFISNFNDGNCIIYDINAQEFINYISPLNNCLSTSYSSFNIEKHLDSNNYFLYCFYSSTEFSLVELNENLEIITDNDYKINEILLQKCSYFYFSNLYYISNNIYILANCNNGNFTIVKLETEQEYIDITRMETNIPKDSIEMKMNKIMSYIQIGYTYIIKGKDYNISIYLINEKKNGSYIELLSCEKKIKNYFSYDENDKLIIFQTEIKNENDKWLNNKIQYEVFNENKTKINLSICEGENIKIHYKINNEFYINLTKISYFDGLGVNIFNSKDPFFTDICFPYSENGLDMVLKDRLKYIYQNYSLCDNGCLYEKVEIKEKTFSCKCSISSKLSKKYEDFNFLKLDVFLLKDSTYEVMRCYKLVFNTKNKLKNLGFWYLIIVFCLNSPIYIIFFVTGIVPIQRYIKNQMEKNHYLINQNNTEINNKEKEFHENTSKIKINNKSKGQRLKNNAKIKTKKIIKNNKISQEILNTNNINKENLKEKGSSSQNELIIDKLNTIIKPETNEINTIINKQINSKDIVEYYALIKIDANNKSKDKKPQESHYILDNYDYKLALKYEKRSFCRIFYIILLSKDVIINALLFKNPLHFKYMRFCLLILSFSIDGALSTLFYFNDKISDNFHYIGTNQFWHSIYISLSTTIITIILSKILVFIFINMTHSKSSIEKEFRKEEEKMRENNNYFVNDKRKLEIQIILNKVLKILKIKIIFFFICDFLIMMIFSYFAIAFSEVYKNTQINVFKDFITSVVITLPTSMVISLIFTILYIISLKYKVEILYKIILFLV